ncbi:MAG: peptidoglycan editing factor PgeF [Chloroflexi bacterium]|nr:peptidoglycan editing factor PgeF [Chloroflexota bacterium]
MNENRARPITYYAFDHIGQFGEVVHAIFGRHGGVSQGTLGSLNASFAVGDEPAAVLANRRLMCQSLGIRDERLVTVKQVHSADVLAIPGSLPPDALTKWQSNPPQCDGVISAARDVYVLMTFGDCVPLVLYDPTARAVGLVHAGWKGTVSRIATRAVEAFAKSFGSDAGRLIVGVGPSIGPCCYEVGEDVTREAVQALPRPQDALITQSTGSIHFDLWEANRQLLVQAGVREANIEMASLCTACNTDRFFSHRGERGKTGRFGAIVGLRRLDG